MEEEYRMQKAQSDFQIAALKQRTRSAAEGASDGGSTVIHEDGSVSKMSETLTLTADDDASTRTVHSSGGSKASEPGGKTDDGGLSSSNSIPIIRVSTESEIEKELAESSRTTPNGTDKDGDGPSLAGPTVEKPTAAAAANEEVESSPSTPQEMFSFTNKRLCERWLDNLFMVLYEVGGNESTSGSR